MIKSNDFQYFSSLNDELITNYTRSNYFLNQQQYEQAFKYLTGKNSMKYENMFLKLKISIGIGSKDLIQKSFSEILETQRSLTDKKLMNIIKYII